MAQQPPTQADRPITPQVPPIPVVHALIIGIDEYPSDSSYHRLAGAVNDARKFRKFVLRYLHADPANIVTLFNRNATRKAIINGFKGLISNEKIKQDDPIIIYYAGHGGRVEKPKAWKDVWPTVTNQIEMMVPYDISPLAGESDFDTSQDDGDINLEEPEVPGIPDRTIAKLLHQLAKEKGDNITLILDCCCSAGLDRGDQFTTRGIAKAPKIPAHCDDDILEAGENGMERGSSHQGFYGKHHASHVLLAACGANQEAKEDPQSRTGFFTSELLRVLTHDDTDINNLTYSSLMNQIRMPDVVNNQTPHCEGQNIGRRLFNKMRSSANPQYIAGRRKSSERGELSAGEVHGVVPESTYAIHAMDVDEPETPGFNPPLFNAIVESVASFTSQLRFITLDVDEDHPHHIPDVFYAKLITEGPVAGAFIVYCDNPIWFNSVIPQETHPALGFTFISPDSNPQSLDPELADLRITCTPTGVFFDRKKGTVVSDFVGTRYRDSFKLQDAKEKLKDLIRAASHFKHRLSRQQSHAGNKEIENQLNTKVWFELKELTQDDYDSRKPVKGNLLLHTAPDQAGKEKRGNEREPAHQARTSDMDDSTVALQVDRWYSLIIHNESSIPLYPYVVFFDPGTLQIDLWYTPATLSDQYENKPGEKSRDSAPLQANAKIGIGYEDPSTSPWTFEFAEGENRDIGYFKVFLTTKNSDFRNVAQETPFDPHSRSFERSIIDRGEEETVAGDAWIAKTIVVKQVPFVRDG